MKEIWKELVENTDYEVSNLGRVRNKYTKCIMKSETINSGYERIKLPKLKNNGSQLVHRMVATAFVPNINNKPHVNHIDANRLNNRSDNLEWVTPKENINDMIDRGTLDTHTARKSLKLPKPVKQLDKDTGELIRVWDSMKEAANALDKVQASKISEVCAGNRPTAGGFKWVFVDPDDGNKNKSSIAGKKIRRISPKGNIKEFNTITKAAESVDVYRSTLTRQLSKETEDGKITYKGYVWEKF